LREITFCDKICSKDIYFKENESMKKLFAVLLTVLMGLSLVACGNSEELEKYKKYETLINFMEEDDYESALGELIRLSEEDKMEKVEEGNVSTVEITTDNWQDYFEIKMVANEEFNDFDELDHFYPEYKICLKEDVAESVVNAEVDFGYQFDKAYYGLFELNTDTKEVTMIEKIEDGLSDGETEEYTSSFSEYEIKEGLSIYNSSYAPESFEHKDNLATIEAEIFEEAEILRVQGTLSIVE
jgi:hypothetical protein